MINSIEIKNFKSIKKKYFPLKNLNILLGLNGMGKSSFIQNLLAFRQSKDLASGRYDLNGDYTNIGSTKDALYQYADRDPFAVNLQFSDSLNLNLQFDYRTDADFFVSPSIVQDPHRENENLGGIMEKEGLFNTSFQYLNANRTGPKSLNEKNYSQVVALENLGNDGRFTVHYIEAFGNNLIEFDNLIHPNSNVKDEITGKDFVNKTLINQINLWMGEISPNVNVRTTSISSDFVMLEYVFKQPNFGNTNRFKPENVGFGISYGLPVVVALLKAKPGDLLIIENPESHIHPKGQAELGKMIALAAMNDVQIIIETHSDHLLNGIRVAVKETNITEDKVGAFYFEKVISSDEQYSKITNIEIDKNGELSEYPKNMLDEWSNQLFKLM
ncbi:MAG: DUF3696 domain-containing protein [Crocinitomicaceae bacterium]|nr:DUF3696 domain-containing protein [Crocinitomicaceae bacterium]